MGCFFFSSLMYAHFDCFSEWACMHHLVSHVNLVLFFALSRESLAMNAQELQIKRKRIPKFQSG